MKTSFRAIVDKALLGLSLISCLQWTSVQAQTDEYVFAGTITQGLPGSPYLTGVAYAMNLTLPSSKALVRDGLYGGAGGSAGFAAGRGGVGGTTPAVFVVNDRVSSGGGVFDGVIYSIFGGTALWYFGADTPFDGTVDGITLVAGSAGDVSSVFTDSSLPSSIDLNQFPKRIASMHFGYPPTTQAVLGTVDRLYINGKLVSVAVPEPSTYSLVVLSGAIFGFGAWRRSKTNAPPPSSVPSRFERT